MKEERGKMDERRGEGAKEGTEEEKEWKGVRGRREEREREERERGREGEKRVDGKRMGE